MTPAYVVAFDPSSDREAIEAVLSRIVGAGGELVLVAGAGVVVRVPEAVARCVEDHPAVSHVGGVTLPDRSPERLRQE